MSGIQLLIARANYKMYQLSIIILSPEKLINIIPTYDLCRAEVFQIVHIIIPNLSQRPEFNEFMHLE